jgi:DNA-binding GntR family transcriptional regulator
MSSSYKPKEYVGYQEILDNVRSIVKRIAPEWAASSIVQEIDNLETTIDEMYAGRQDQAEEMMRHDIENDDK